eukprot:NODE_800_length_693_cov_69.645963_g730_i0.p1 GENE.NODE_800_length_693_cov_69.645963_g730_i0~~NODE_800_length_693_cov_69.645963_g730_i0.p1  ORF type:complete len:173 (-),score=23.77 NODE_800_length_693_cov_69.645963_g730_i0:109-627(-)
MDAFIDAYFAIDVNRTETITTNELKRYMKRNNYDDNFVQKWLILFDQDGSGTIELREYCNVLGLEYASVKAKHVHGGVSRQLPATVEIISSDMKTDSQFSIYECLLEAHEKHGDMKNVVKYLKQRLDKAIEPLFHVVAVKGQFWCWFSQEPGYSFIFRYNGIIYIIWKTPAP